MKRKYSVELSEETYNALIWLGRNYCGIPEDKSTHQTPTQIVERLVQEMLDEASPSSYQTPGFDRQ